MLIKCETLNLTVQGLESLERGEAIESYERILRTIHGKVKWMLKRELSIITPSKREVDEFTSALEVIRDLSDLGE